MERYSCSEKRARRILSASEAAGKIKSAVSRIDHLHKVYWAL